MLNKAREIMKQRESMIKEAQETLVVLGATNEATVVTNEIVINKGKIVEVPVVKYETKEVVVDNTDTETIEMLRETIRQMNQNMNDMIKQHEEEIAKLKEQYEQQMLDMTSEFEYEVECIVNKREKQIKELEEKLDFKELLLKEFNENMDEKIKTIHALEDKIEELEDKIDGMKFGYENKIAKLKEKANKPQMKIEVVDDPDFNDVPEEKPVTNNKPMNNPISLTYTSLHVTHDAIKAIAHDKANGVTFHFVWKAGQEKLPCYSATGARGTWSRMNGTGMYRYGKQIVEDFKQLAEEKIISKTKDGKVKTTKANKPNKPEDKPVVKVTKEVVVETNDDPLGNTDDMEFDCYDC